MNDVDMRLAKAKLRSGAIDRWAYDTIERLEADLEAVRAERDILAGEVLP